CRVCRRVRGSGSAPEPGPARALAHRRARRTRGSGCRRVRVGSSGQSITAACRIRVMEHGARHRFELDERGYTTLEGVLSAARLDLVVSRIDALFASEGEDAGSEFRPEPGAPRLANLADKGDVFVEC